MDLIANVGNRSLINPNFIMNASKYVDQALIEKFSKNRNVEDPAYYILIIMYSVLILFGAFGNTLVVIAVVRKPVMRTARNMFILNLAISDLLLCVVTMPLTLVEILTKYWPLGKHTIICKMISTLQATSIFVSTISITAIALDRYQVIVYPTRDNLQFMGALGILTAIWALALLLASPMFLFKQLIHYEIPLHAYGIYSVAYCIEEWPIEHGRIYYSAFSLFVQYLLPIVSVSAAYFRIYHKLKNRLPTGATPATATATNNKSERRIERGRRMKRTNCLLISIAVIFGVSWLPLNLFNLYADIYLSKNGMTQPVIVTYAICHMMGMSSACSNPLLYGWLNENFRKEFKELLCRYSDSTNVVHLNGRASQKGRKQLPDTGDVSQMERKLISSSKSTKSTRLAESAVVADNGVSTELTVLMR